MIRKLTALSVTIALALALAAPAALAGKKSDKFKEEIHESFDTGTSGRLTLTNINGDVTVTGYDGKTIQVDAIKYASTQQKLDESKIEFHTKNQHLTIDVDIDNDRRDHHDGSARIEFKIRVPRGTSIDDLELVNGDLGLDGIAGRVDASSVNGDVTGEKLSGDVDLSAVNGDVSLTVVGVVESIKLHSVNGTVELMIPRDANARVSASTVHGSIRGTGDIKAEKNFVGSSLSSVLGNGDGKIAVNTVNGNIRIYQGGDKRAD
jgi:DUF4097 and DUF4098 domain-containing protein YvlB